ncbi:MAG: type II and III secretion system protein, partial [Verrucomicrobiota bacterium]
GTFVNAAGIEVPRVPAFIRALSQDREVEILSNVPLWAQDNKEASVSVVENIPVRTSTISGGSGTARDVIQNIERIDVGIQLKLTPHVNPNDEILLELNPSIDVVVDNGPAGAFSPTIAKRQVTTTVTVPDRATIILSGLIQEDSIKTESKIPLLGDIPLLGNLFKSRSDRTQKTNLLIFVTPRIVRDMAEADAIRKSLEARSGLNFNSRPKVSLPSVGGE